MVQREIQKKNLRLDVWLKFSLNIGYFWSFLGFYGLFATAGPPLAHFILNVIDLCKNNIFYALLMEAQFFAPRDTVVSALFVLLDKSKDWRVFLGIRFCAKVEAKGLHGIVPCNRK